MEFIDIIVLACGILCLISGAIACLYNYLTGLIIIVGGVYLLFLVMYEVEEDKKHKEFMRRVYDDDC